MEEKKKSLYERQTIALERQADALEKIAKTLNAWQVSKWYYGTKTYELRVIKK